MSNEFQEKRFGGSRSVLLNDAICANACGVLWSGKQVTFRAILQAFPPSLIRNTSHDLGELKAKREDGLRSDLGHIVVASGTKQPRRVL